MSIFVTLLGNHIDIARAEWVYREAGIGGNVDSYYEYLLKAGIYFEDVSTTKKRYVMSLSGDQSSSSMTLSYHLIFNPSQS